jgi:SAM-dependent methyltransferase
VRGDAFHLPIAAATFDAAFTLRFVRHFAAGDRARLYAELRRVLRPGGVLLVDAQNRAVRPGGHVERHPVYDELYTPESLRDELADHGFRLAGLHGMLWHHRVQRRLNRLRAYGLAGPARRLIAALEHLPSARPSFWMVVAERA